MRPIKKLTTVLESITDEEHCLFTLSDLHGAMPEQSSSGFKALVCRAEKDGLLKRVCRGVYLYRTAKLAQGLLLYHAAARLRAGEFNYISLESALSDAGVISQIPMNWITVMSSGRTTTVSCGAFGSIEFIHTKRRPENLASHLTYDMRCHLWRASVELALKDMNVTRRTTDLVDMEAVDELV
jgi:predicted transcriptional regulator of viral defense system